MRPSTAFRLPLFQAERAAARGALGEERSVARTCALVDHAIAFSEATIDEDRRSAPPERPIACRDGCAWCCYARVVLSEAEVLRIAEHLRSSLGPAALEAIRERVRAAAEATTGMDSDARFAARVPCPLLQDERCTAHAVRPLACLGYNSADADACERAWRQRSADRALPTYVPQLMAAGAVQAGMVLGLREAGLRGSALELNASLRIALEREGVGERWLAGRHPFAAAVVEDSQANLEQLLAGVVKGEE